MGREGAGLQMKNHEGYYDLTAGKAIRRAYRAKRRGGGRKTRRLTYLIGELRGGVPCDTSKMILVKIQVSDTNKTLIRKSEHVQEIEVNQKNRIKRPLLTW